VSEKVEHELPSQGSPAGALESTPADSEKNELIEVPPLAASDLAQEREVEALQSLYRQVVHLPEPEPEYQPDGPITRSRSQSSVQKDRSKLRYQKLRRTKADI
jgi:hypothetical protein